MLASMLTPKKKINNDVKSSMLASVPHQFTYMRKKGVQYTCCSLVKEPPPSKEYLPPTFGPIGSKCTRVLILEQALCGYGVYLKSSRTTAIRKNKRCPTFGLHDKQINTNTKVFNAGFKADTKTHRCWVQF